MSENLARADFVRAHTSLSQAPLVPEISLHLAREDTELWRATAAWLHARDVPPPFWAFAWPGGQALARWVLDHKEVVRGSRVVDFGCGSGIVAIAAAMAGAQDVRACDSDELALAACSLNAIANGATLQTLSDLAEVSFRGGVLVFAADVLYDRKAADDTMAILRRARHEGARVMLADPRRPYFSGESFELEASFDVPVLPGLESADVMPTDVFRMR